MKQSFKIIIGISVIITLIIGGFLFYQFYYLPYTVKLPVPKDPPFFSVYYLYSLEPSSLSAFKFGSQEVPAQELSKTIENDLKTMKSAGFDGIKISFQFKQDNYISDRIALKAANQKLYPIGILVGHNAKPTDRAFTDEELNEWASFVRYEVRKNKNIIYYWEIWNEPAEGMFRYGTTEEYIALLNRTYKIIKEENPQAKVIVTLDPFHDETNHFSQEFLAKGGSDYFDILSFHPYAANPYIQEDKFNISLANAKRMGAKINKPLWITEIGQPTSEVSEQRQAELAGFIMTSSYKDHIPIIWFHYSDQRAYMIAPDSSYGWGLLDRNGNPKPVLDTIKNFTNQNKYSNPICTSFSSNNCPSECVVCPPCEVCSSISCQTEDFCKNIGFDRSWYEAIKERLSNMSASER